VLNLQGQHIKLRALEPEDLQFLYTLENNPDIWEISGTTAPFSKHVLAQYLENAHRDIYEIKQLRLVISDMKDHAIGLIDLFDFDPKNQRAGVGIIVLESTARNKGYGAEALNLLEKHCISVLGLKQLYANILEDNKASIHLFEKLGYILVGTKKEWIFSNGSYKNEMLYQKILN